LIVANFDPANAAALQFPRALRNHGPIVGPFGGRLENNGEAIELTKPDARNSRRIPTPDSCPTCW
jgi:hypothetical protein